MRTKKNTQRKREIINYNLPLTSQLYNHCTKLAKTTKTKTKTTKHKHKQRHAIVHLHMHPCHTNLSCFASYNQSLRLYRPLCRHHINTLTTYHNILLVSRFRSSHWRSRWFIFFLQTRKTVW